MDDEPLIARLLPAEHAHDHVPRRALAAFDTILVDLFELAHRTLVDGGR